ncbi:hypothetical protein WALSEDRAFT_60511 [Wallemia mellicola CBS 633.66]|uniref:Uncharacterized protein n=1 Tax=Wallemia mellicola (strain ATCC MYA-4683 / CBS 633.66) TaxID=671144 RepID=I4YBG0_WALMC|nr:hypothetical protein WALSEDRAFT_60511 [Wallemia mellicola CBS 633.66]EIM21302.1 hypothetical protein WALSEDRAFT_60511 [Wallemia mellicola CBS 633.66]|eukprot:XP_006958654.1 hypothetical protein WALSEDRAFT_60511 [Wallemia mellicola CBS 633.66]
MKKSMLLIMEYKPRYTLRNYLDRCKWPQLHVSLGLILLSLNVYVIDGCHEVISSMMKAYLDYMNKAS